VVGIAVRRGAQLHDHIVADADARARGDESALAGLEPGAIDSPTIVTA
jgi:hypothetical protein